MTVSREFLDFVLDQLAPLGPVTPRRMFGSVGLYHDGRMFALITGDNRLYVKGDMVNRARYDDSGCRPFTYRTTKGRQVALPYYAPPETALEERHELLAWARLGMEAALRTPESPRQRKRRAAAERAR